MERKELLAALREKLDAGYESYMKDMVSRGAEITFENADEIHYNQEIYDAMQSDDLLSDEQLTLLMQFKDPLQVLRDQWSFWNEAVLKDDHDTETEMVDAVQGFYNNMDSHIGDKYEMEGPNEPAERNQDRQQEQQLM